MIISPDTAIKSGWVQGIHNVERQLQPNAIDFTLDNAYTVTESPFELYIGEDGTETKRMRGGTEIDPYKEAMKDFATWRLDGGSMIDCLSNMYVEVPNDVAVMLFPRSTITRNGIFLTSGLYDTGFKGHIGFLLHNRSKGRALLGPGVRVGQCMFVSADSVGQYSGGWNHHQGTHTPNVC